LSVPCPLKWKPNRPAWTRAESLGATLVARPDHTEERALAELLKRTIEADHYPLSPRIRTLQAILCIS
jgi:hypothetical protein